MAYSIDLRSRVIDYIKAGHTQEETSILFKVGTSTIKRWLSLLSETGSLEKRPLNRTARLYDSEKLNAYIKENANARLKDVAEHFGGSSTGAYYALARNKITYKKKKYSIKKETKRNAGSLTKN
jgi:transposase